jgi:hypothetical protein
VSISNPGCDSNLAQYAHTPILPPATLRVAMRAWPLLRVAGFEDEDDDEDEYEAPSEVMTGGYE